MEGRSHLIVGLAGGVVLDSIFHITGHPITMSGNVPLSLLIDKTIFYISIGFGALLPDIDNARSTIGRKTRVLSETIQHFAGHRTLFHSFLGLSLGVLFSVGCERLIAYEFLLHDLLIPAYALNESHLIVVAVFLGCLLHITADALTFGGVPLFWPYKKRYGFPPIAQWRFRTGTWPEFVVVGAFVCVVGIGIIQGILHI